MNKKQSPSRSI